MKSILDHDENHKELMIILVEQAIPCVLHLGNCVGETIIRMLLGAGVDSRPASQFSAFVKEAADYINSHCLGTEDVPSQWKVLISENKKELAAARCPMERQGR